MANLDFLDQLNEKQAGAVVHSGGPALVLAGAGSGKTRVLTARVAYLLATQKDLRPEQILLVTFTNKAAIEMKNRVRRLTGIDLPLSGTFHSFAAKILRQHAPAVKLPYNFTIYDADDQLALLKSLYKDNGWNARVYKPASVRAAISDAKNHLLTPEAYREKAYGDFGEFVATAYELYQMHLRREDALDFDDLLNDALRLLEEDHFVREKYQNQIVHVLIDEYQDTNTAQYRLSRLLAAPQNNLFVVGDFSQSIYAWRGADYHNMLHLQKDYPDLQTYHLDQNYRSIQPILTAATQVIQHDTDHPILHLWTDKKDDTRLPLFDCETGEQEAATVASEIESLRGTFDLSEMAILYRTNAQSRVFEEALTRRGLPYRLVGGFKFYERKEIKDTLAYLHLYENPKESVSIARCQKIGKRRFRDYLAWREAYQANPDRSEKPADVLEAILTATNYRALYDQNDPEEAVKLDNLQELLTAARSFQTIANFLENVALIQDDYGPDGKRNTGPERDEVTLMSLHSAKGLEFEVVFLVGLEENLLPHSRSLYDGDQLAEERRLCYVGITRAKHKLYFTHARRRWLYGSVETTCRSRFLDDIDPNLLEVSRLEEYVDDFQGSYQRAFQQLSHRTPSFDSDSFPARTIDTSDSQLEDVLYGRMSPEVFINGRPKPKR